MDVDKALNRVDEISRFVTRTSAVAAIVVFAIAVVVLAAHRGPYVTGPSIARTVRGELVELAGLTSLISLGASLPAVMIFISGKVWEHRTIHWYIVLNMVTLLLVVMTPVW